MSTEVSVENSGNFQAAIDQVRSDDNDTNWALFGHVDGNPNVIGLVASGSGGLVEFVENLKDDEVMYGYLRFLEQFEMSVTVKFVYVRFMGSGVAFTKRGKFGVVEGSVKATLANFQASFHTSVEASSQEEITEEGIRQKLQEQSGTKSKVLEVEESKSRPERGFVSSDTKGAGSRSSGFTGQSVQKVSAGGASVSFDSSVEDAIKEVRSDGSPSMWCVASYPDNSLKNPITVIGCGSEHADFQGLFDSKSVAYALYRVTDLVDNIPTVKFAFINWLGEEAKPMFKAKVPTHKGAVEDKFGAAHAKIFATTISEVSYRAIVDKVQAASGTKSRVK
jgi:hypothetical protein